MSLASSSAGERALENAKTHALDSEVLKIQKGASDSEVQSWWKASNPHHSGF